MTKLSRSADWMSPLTNCGGGFEGVGKREKEREVRLSFFFLLLLSIEEAGAVAATGPSLESQERGKKQDRADGVARSLPFRALEPCLSTQGEGKRGAEVSRAQGRERARLPRAASARSGDRFEKRRGKKNSFLLFASLSTTASAVFFSSSLIPPTTHLEVGLVLDLIEVVQRCAVVQLVKGDDLKGLGGERGERSDGGR